MRKLYICFVCVYILIWSAFSFLDADHDLVEQNAVKSVKRMRQQGQLNFRHNDICQHLVSKKSVGKQETKLRNQI